MAQVIVTESSLENIAGAIRAKLGTQATYKPAQMAGAIAQIHGDPVLEALNVNANGTYTPSSGKDGFSQAVVNVPNSYSSGDEGKVVSGGALVAQSSQSITQNGTYDTTLKNQAIVSVPNSYSASDEGKVVDNGALVAQSSQTITDNGTYDTTLKNQVTVNVSGGGSSDIVTADYEGLAWSYIAINGQYFQNNGGKIYYSNYFHVVPNHKYAIFVDEPYSDRFRAHFYAGKTYTDFEQYVNNSMQNQAVYTSTVNITGTTELSGNDITRRFLFTPTSEGEIVVVTSRTSVAVKAFCIKLT